MFVRVKSTKNSPRKSVQIVASQRIDGKVKQKIIKHIGIAMDDAELEELKVLANSIKVQLEQTEQLPLYTNEELEKRLGETRVENNKPSKRIETSKDFKRSISEGDREKYNVNLLDLIEEDRVIKGIHDIYGKLYDELGFDRIIPNSGNNIGANKALKEIVLARIANPDSKRGSVNELASKFGVHLNLKTVYRMMDLIEDKQIIKLNKKVSDHTRTLLDDKVDVVYFDATTLYFESFTEDIGEDGIKKNGYSKDGKFNQPQVVLALLVTKSGLPIGYKAFSGDTFDGHTLLPALEDAKEEYNIDKTVYVADSGMFNKANLEELDKKENTTYIVGARIKNMSKDLTQQILDIDSYEEFNDDMKIKIIDYNGKKLIISNSKKRAAKDKYEREKGIEKLKARLEKNKSVKTHLSNQGYKKYLKLENSNDNTNKDNCKCEISIILDEEKIKEDSIWDGLKGIVTNNSELSNKEIINQYANLWQVEESFRITKHDLKIRPIYHWKPSRVKAHLAISFMAYTLVRTLEHRVRLQYKKLSPKKIKEILLSVQSTIYYDTKQNIKYAMPSSISDDAKKIYRLMDSKLNLRPRILRSA